LPHLAEIHHAIYPGIFIEPFAGGAGTSIIIVHGQSNAGLLIDQNPAVAAFWREAIETYELTRKAAAFMDLRGRGSDQVESLERDPSFWAYIQPLFSPGNDLISGHSEKARHDSDIENLVEFLKQIHLVSGRVRILEADAWQLLDQYAQDSEEYAFFAAPYVECGKFEYDSYAYDQKWLVKMLAGWKGRWLFSYDRPNHLVKIVFLRPAASADCSAVSWMTPMAVNFHPPTRQASHSDDR
jgi:hypothetical protein